MSAQRSALHSWFLRIALSLRAALVLTVLVGVTLPAALTSYHDHQRLTAQFAAQLQADLEASGNLLTLVLANPVWDFDKDQIDAIIDAAFADPRIVSIAVLKQGETMERRLERRRPGAMPTHILTFSGELKVNKKTTAGEVILVMDGESYRHQLQEAFDKDIARVLQSLLGSLVLIFLLLQVRLMRPIDRLVSASVELAKGNLTTPITSARSDELGRLAQSLESTRQALASLFQRLDQRTAALSESNAALSAANNELTNAYSAAKTSQELAEHAEHQATQAFEELRSAQGHLVQSEKMAALGILIAGVAHEINTPIGAIKSSGSSITDALGEALTNLPSLFQKLDSESMALFLGLILRANERTTVLGSREARAAVTSVSQELEAAGIDNARHTAGILVKLNAQAVLADYLPLLRHSERELILDTASSIAVIIGLTHNINTAVERVAKIILALKSFSRVNQAAEMIAASLQDGLETVLTIYNYQIKQHTEVVRQYDDIPPLHCLPDELNQVWTNLIHNALQAMDTEGKSGGTLTIGISQVGNEAMVSIGDSGSGIPEAIRGKIFDVFFTTKPAGVGSGLGLDIVKKIIDKHKGRIEVHSEVGVGTTFSVYLPYVREVREDP